MLFSFLYFYSLKAKEVLKVIAAKWRELSEDEKNEYKKKAEEQ